MCLTTLFIYLKFILLQCFQFSTKYAVFKRIRNVLFWIFLYVHSELDIVCNISQIKIPNYSSYDMCKACATL